MKNSWIDSVWDKKTLFQSKSSPVKAIDDFLTSSEFNHACIYNIYSSYISAHTLYEYQYRVELLELHVIFHSQFTICILRIEIEAIKFAYGS